MIANSDVPFATYFNYFDDKGFHIPPAAYFQALLLVAILV